MLAKGDPRHGTTNGYSNLDCRCDRCRKAWTQYCLAYRHEKGLSEPWESYLDQVRLKAELRNHGTEVRYNGGCRCEHCRAAASDAKRFRRLKSRVPCSHGCGAMVDSINRRNPEKPPECRPCSIRRVHAERKAAAVSG